MSKIKIFALGGLNENGKNMYVVNVDEEIFVFDAGLKYDNDINLGIDYIIPNIDYLINNREKIKGIFLTHGHDGNIGGIADVLEQLPEVPVYGTRLTLKIAKKDISDELLKTVKLIEIKPHVKLDFGKNSIFPISVTHSIPEAVCYVLYTPDGAIVYTGDFVFDSTMIGPYKTDIGKLAYVGKQGVLCLLCESFYADKQGHTSPNNRVKGFIRDVLAKTNNRIIATIFPAHYYRIQEIFDEVSKTHRKIVVMGKPLQEMINSAIEDGYLKIDKSMIGTLADIDSNNSVVLISDEKEKPFANLDRIIKGFDKYIEIKENDTIFITEPSYPGIEKRTAVIMDEIAMLGADAVSLSSKKHLLHHSSREDLMLMIDLMNPKYYFPVKGEYRNQYTNGEIAEELGLPKENIILKLNGDVLELVAGENTNSLEHIETGDILIDGKSQSDIGNLVLKDREMLGENGIVIISCTLDKDTKEILGGPEILTRGFIYVKESQDLLEETKKISREVIENTIASNGNKVDYTLIKNDVRDVLGKFFYQETESKPMIITVIQEI
ncbi:MAG: ribonuclease J [Bacilli bacterium]|nr:ribonuclease J [Bacilli bacterium]MBR6137447.1 ribonuclease J [Bacilli bacterium]